VGASPRGRPIFVWSPSLLGKAVLERLSILEEGYKLIWGVPRGRPIFIETSQIQTGAPTEGRPDKCLECYEGIAEDDADFDAV